MTRARGALTRRSRRRSARTPERSRGADLVGARRLVRRRRHRNGRVRAPDVRAVRLLPARCRARPRDRDGKPHPIRVDVGRTGLTVRAHRAMMSVGEAAAAAPRARRRAIVTAALSSPLPRPACRFAPSRSRSAASRPAKCACWSTRESDPSTRGRSGSPVGYYVVDKDGKTSTARCPKCGSRPRCQRRRRLQSSSRRRERRSRRLHRQVAVADGDRSAASTCRCTRRCSIWEGAADRARRGRPGAAGQPAAPSVGTRVSFGTVHGYLEAYGPDAADARRAGSKSPPKNAGRRFSAPTSRARYVGDERVIFSQSCSFRRCLRGRIGCAPSSPGQHAADDARAGVRNAAGGTRVRTSSAGGAGSRRPPRRSICLSSRGSRSGPSIATSR